MTAPAFVNTGIAGACAHPAVSPEMFFDDSRIPEAVQLCSACPLRHACLEYAMTVPQYGVWGATTEPMRRDLARQMGRKYQPRDAEPPTRVRVAARCGTPSGARAHYRRGEKPCTECREAAARDRNPENHDRRRGNWYRRVAS